MQTFINTTLKIICLLVFLFAANSCTRFERMHEAENNSQAQNQAPTESLTVFREFFAYVQKSEPSIVTDEQAQNRWLTQRMRKSFVSHINRSGSPTENPAYPSNATFTCVWNQPTTYSIVGSRHYDHRNGDNPNDNRAIIDVLYEWDTYSDGINNQYPGEKSLYSFIFVFEDGAWKLDDIYTFDDEYTSAESLRSFFGKE
jgi:hypothetical protein